MRVRDSKKKNKLFHYKTHSSHPQCNFFCFSPLSLGAIMLQFYYN